MKSMKVTVWLEVDDEISLVDLEDEVYNSLDETYQVTDVSAEDEYVS